VYVVADDESAQRLIQALGELEAVASAVSPEEAVRSLDEATLQVFWRDWPNISSWAGALWRRLNQDLAGPARPSQDPDLDETGGSG
jgi:hypothetical protein